MTNGDLPVGDRAALMDILTEVAWRVDHGHAATVHELFVEDGEMTLLEDTHKGREAIAAWGRKKDKEGNVIRHIVTNMRLVRVGKNRVKGTAIVTAYGRSGSDRMRPEQFIVGEYTDEFLKTSAGWRIVSRRLEPLFKNHEV